MTDVTRAKIPSLCGAIWRTILNFYPSQGVWVNCYRIHQKWLNFIYPFKFYSNFKNKNVSWLHFSCATQYVLAGLSNVPAWGVGTIPGLCAKVRSSELRHVCYRINILGSQLSPSSINLVPASAGKVTVGLSSHWPCVNRHRFIHLRAQRPKTGRWTPTHMTLWGVAPFTFTLLGGSGGRGEKEGREREHSRTSFLRI